MHEVVPFGTVGECIEEVRRSLPPSPKRSKPRLPYINYDDMAELIGTTRQQLVLWVKGEAYPAAKNREQLALLSGGRFTADNFRVPREPSELAQVMARLDSMESQLVKLTRAVEKLKSKG